MLLKIACKGFERKKVNTGLVKSTKEDQAINLIVIINPLRENKDKMKGPFNLLIVKCVRNFILGSVLLESFGVINVNEKAT